MHLDNFRLPGIKIEQLYIKWDEKIAVDIGSITITESNTKRKFDIKAIEPQALLEKSRMLDLLFSDITVKRIRYNEINATFRYKEHTAGYLNIDGPAFKLAATVTMADHLLLIDINEFLESSNKSSMNGRLLIDTRESKLYGDLNINAGDVMPLKLYLLADQTKMQLWGRGTEPFTKPIKPAVRIAHLHPKVERWVADYHSGKAIDLAYFKGTLVYDNPITLLDTLDARLRYDDVQYTFAQGYEPVFARYVDVTFKDRVLSIYPKEATYYAQPGDKTWLKIDFSNPSNPLLTVDVDTSAQVTQAMLPWLKGYGIALPFYQTAGETAVKLAIWVELATLHVGAEGSFKTDEATFNFSDTAIDVKDVVVKLNNSDVEIQKLNATLLENAINADLSGQFNPAKRIGKFDIALHRLKFKSGSSLFEMDPEHKTLNLTYLLAPKKERLEIPKSYWRLNQNQIVINPFTAPFEFSTLSGTVPTTLVSSESMFKGYVTGLFNIKKLETDLIVDLLTVKTPSLSLEQTTLPLEIRYKDGLYLNVKKRSEWKFGETRFTLYPSLLSFKNSLVYIQTAHIALGDLLETYFSGSYNTQSSRGSFMLKGLKAETGNTRLLETPNDIKVTVDKAGSTHIVKIPSLDLLYQQNASEWNASISDINTLSQHSPFLREYNITAGDIRLTSAADSGAITLFGHIPYPYAILVKNNIPAKTVDFNGIYNDGKLALTINDTIKASWKHERLNIKAKDVGFNLPAIFSFIKEHPAATDANSTKSRFRADIEADNSSLYINEGRSAPADKLLLQYLDGDLNTQLLHGKKGGVSLEYSNKKLYIYGDSLNDTFMNGLAEFSDFQGGELSFYALGSPDDLEGVIQVKNTIVKDYKAVNNIFAFVNTIPALVTFSVPHYTTQGLKVSEAYGGFALKDDLLTIKGFHVNADELIFNGKGSVDLNTKTVDVETSLVTNATTNLAKIPFIGYILLGKDDNKVTTTITLTGPIEDPKVENTLAKDIAIAPFNILKRALTFPVHYFDKAQKAIDENNQKKE